MSLPLFLLRHPTSHVSPALYSPTYRDVSVRITESHTDKAAFHYGDREDGQPGTYRKLLELLLTAKKVVTL